MVYTHNSSFCSFRYTISQRIAEIPVWCARVREYSSHGPYIDIRIRAPEKSCTVLEEEFIYLQIHTSLKEKRPFKTPDLICFSNYLIRWWRSWNIFMENFKFEKKKKTKKNSRCRKAGKNSLFPLWHKLIVKQRHLNNSGIEIYRQLG